MQEIKLDSKYWNNRYLNSQIGWDITSVSRPLKEYLDQVSNKKSSILIPGCGNAHEAIYATSIGYTDVHILDFAEYAINNFANKFVEFKKENIHLEDFFLHVGAYDLILEQTFFCAIEPSMRKLYAEKMYALLKRGGKLVGLLFDREFDSGPPFGGCKEEYLEYFSPLFYVKVFEKSYNSIEARSGSELFIILEKK